MAGQFLSDCEIPIGWGIEEDVEKVIHLSEHCSILSFGALLLKLFNANREGFILCKWCDRSFKLS